MAKFPISILTAILVLMGSRLLYLEQEIRDLRQSVFQLATISRMANVRANDEWVENTIDAAYADIQGRVDIISGPDNLDNRRLR